MKRILLATAFIMIGYTLTAQAQATAPQALKKIMTLKMPKTADDAMPGTRGASVAWHPEHKKYYAVFAGNQGYPLGVFDENGNRVSSDALAAFIDTRGLWYHPGKKLIMGNAYSDNGWFSYLLNSKGIPADVEEMLEGENQPDPQSVGAYNSTAKQVLFLKNSFVYSYDEEGDVQDSVAIHWSRTKTQGPADGETPHEENEDYNSSTVIYSGIKGSELGLLNVTNKQVELYDIKTGYLTKVLALPENAKTELFFNFAYANGIYWLFDMAKREWTGYK